MNEKTEDLPTTASARRRLLLRGTFAAPAVMTLVSGSAFAATSLTCLAKQQAAPVNAPADPSGAIWLRVPVYQCVSSKDATQYANFVSGADIAALAPPGGSYLMSAQAQCILSTWPKFTVGQIKNTSSLNPSPSPLAGKFVAVRVDGAGKVTGIQGIQSANTAMSTSCWNSVHGANPFAAG